MAAMNNAVPTAAGLRTPPRPLPIEPYFRSVPGSEPFLQVIAESPDDDMTRLVFADWLEDHGQPARAEFNRVQWQAAGGGVPGERFFQLMDRERELLAEHEPVWKEGVEHVKGLNFARGMLEVLPLRRFVALSEQEQA